MANTIGEEYDHLTLSNGTNAVDHPIKDVTVRGMLDGTTSLNGLKFISDDGSKTAELYLDEDGTISTKLLTGSITRKVIEHTLSGEIYNENVVNIAPYAFEENTQITSVTLPNAIDVGVYAFSGITNLLEFNGPKVTNIYNNAFYNCLNLLSAYIPSATKISRYGFWRCRNLKCLFLPKVNTITNNAFNECTALIDIYVPFASDSSSASGAPWGATNATVHYSTSFDENGEPIS